MNRNRSLEAYDNIQEVIDIIDSLAFTGAILEDEAKEMIDKLVVTQTILLEE